MASDLNKKQQKFVSEYLVDQNATRAYIAAGYSENGAKTGASRLLANVNVAAAINKKHTARLDRLEISADRVLAEIARVAFLDPRKFFNPDGSLKQVADLDDETASALAGMDVDEMFAGRGDDKAVIGTTKKVKIADKLRALEMLGKHLKMFTDKVEVGGKDGGPIPVSVIDEILATHGRAKS